MTAWLTRPFITVKPTVKKATGHPLKPLVITCGLGWEILERSKKLPFSKRWRFLPDAMKEFGVEGGFLERQLNDVRYISRYATEYLSTVVPKNKIWVVTVALHHSLEAFGVLTCSEGA